MINFVLFSFLVYRVPAVLDRIERLYLRYPQLTDEDASKLKLGAPVDPINCVRLADVITGEFSRVITFDVTVSELANICVITFDDDAAGSHKKIFAELFSKKYWDFHEDRKLKINYEFKTRLDPYSVGQWYIDSPYKKDIRLEEASKISKGPQIPAGGAPAPELVKWVIMDSGMDLEHPDLKDVVDESTGSLDCTAHTDDTKGPDSANLCHRDDNMVDGIGHATSLVGMVSANRNNGVGTTGIVGSWSKVIPIKIGRGRGDSNQNWVNSFDILKALNQVLTLPEPNVILMAWTINVRPQESCRIPGLYSSTEGKLEDTWHNVKSSWACAENCGKRIVWPERKNCRFWSHNEITKVCETFWKVDDREHLVIEEEGWVSGERLCAMESNGPYFDSGRNEFSGAMEKIRELNKIVVTSTGDEKKNLDPESDHNQSWPTYLSTDPKASVIAVASSTPNGAATVNSNTSPEVVNVFAPGESIVAPVSSGLRKESMASVDVAKLENEYNSCMTYHEPRNRLWKCSMIYEEKIKARAASKSATDLEEEAKAEGKFKHFYNFLQTEQYGDVDPAYVGSVNGFPGQLEEESYTVNSYTECAHACYNNLECKAWSFKMYTPDSCRFLSKIPEGNPKFDPAYVSGFKHYKNGSATTNYDNEMNWKQSYRYLDGSSLSAAEVVGVLLHLTGMFPDVPMSQIREWLLSGATKSQALKGLSSTEAIVDLNKSIMLARAGPGAAPPDAGQLIYFASGTHCIGTHQIDPVTNAFRYPKFHRTQGRESSNDFDSITTDNRILVHKVLCDSPTNPFGNYWILPHTRTGQMKLAANDGRMSRICVGVENNRMVMKICANSKTIFLFDQGTGPIRVIKSDDPVRGPAIDAFNLLGHMPCVQADEDSGEMVIRKCEGLEKIEFSPSEMDNFNDQVNNVLNTKQSQAFIQRYTVGPICEGKSGPVCWIYPPTTKYLIHSPIHPGNAAQFIFSTQENMNSSLIRPLDRPDQCVTVPNFSQSLTFQTSPSPNINLIVDKCRPIGYNGGQEFIIKNGFNVKIQLRNGDPIDRESGTFCVGTTSLSRTVVTSSDRRFCNNPEEHNWRLGSYLLVYPQAKQLEDNDAPSPIHPNAIPKIVTDEETLVGTTFQSTTDGAENIAIDKDIPIMTITYGNHIFEFKNGESEVRYLNAQPDGKPNIAIFKEHSENGWIPIIKKTWPATQIWMQETGPKFEKCLEVQDKLFEHSDYSSRLVKFSECDKPLNRNSWHVPDPAPIWGTDPSEFNLTPKSQVIRWAGGTLDGSDACLTLLTRISGPQALELGIVPCKHAATYEISLLKTGNKMFLGYTKTPTGGEKKIFKFKQLNVALQIYVPLRCNIPKIKTEKEATMNSCIGKEISEYFVLVSPNCNHFRIVQKADVVKQLEECTVEHGNENPCHVAETFICQPQNHPVGQVQTLIDWTGCDFRSHLHETCNKCSDAEVPTCVACDKRKNYELNNNGTCQIAKTTEAKCTDANTGIPECESCVNERPYMCASCNGEKVPSRDGLSCVTQCMHVDRNCAGRCDSSIKTKCEKCQEGYETDTVTGMCSPYVETLPSLRAQGEDPTRLTHLNQYVARCPRSHPYVYGDDAATCCTVRKNFHNNCTKAGGVPKTCRASHCLPHISNMCPQSHPKALGDRHTKCCPHEETLPDASTCTDCKDEACHDYNDPLISVTFAITGDQDQSAFSPCSRKCCYGHRYKLSQCPLAESKCVGLAQEYEFCLGDDTLNEEDDDVSCGLGSSFPKCLGIGEWPETRGGKMASISCENVGHRNHGGRVYRKCNENGQWDISIHYHTCTLLIDDAARPERKNYCDEEDNQGWIRTPAGQTAQQPCGNRGTMYRECARGRNGDNPPAWQEATGCQDQAYDPNHMCTAGTTDFVIGQGLPNWTKARDFFHYCASVPSPELGIHVVLVTDVKGQVVQWAQANSPEEAEREALRKCRIRLVQVTATWYLPETDGVHGCRVAEMDRRSCPAHTRCAHEKLDGGLEIHAAGSECACRNGRVMFGDSDRGYVNIVNLPEDNKKILCHHKLFNAPPPIDGGVLRECLCETEKPKVHCTGDVYADTCGDCPSNGEESWCDSKECTMHSGGKRCMYKEVVDKTTLSRLKREGRIALREEPGCEGGCGEYQECCGGGNPSSGVIVNPFCANGLGDVGKAECIDYGLANLGKISCFMPGQERTTQAQEEKTGELRVLKGEYVNDVNSVQDCQKACSARNVGSTAMRGCLSFNFYPKAKSCTLFFHNWYIDERHPGPRKFYTQYYKLARTTDVVSGNPDCEQKPEIDSKELINLNRRVTDCYSMGVTYVFNNIFVSRSRVKPTTFDECKSLCQGIRLCNYFAFQLFTNKCVLANKEEVMESAIPYIAASKNCNIGNETVEGLKRDAFGPTKYKGKIIYRVTNEGNCKDLKDRPGQKIPKSAFIFENYKDCEDHCTNEKDFICTGFSLSTTNKEYIQKTCELFEGDIQTTKASYYQPLDTLKDPVNANQLTVCSVRMDLQLDNCIENEDNSSQKLCVCDKSVCGNGESCRPNLNQVPNSNSKCLPGSWHVGKCSEGAGVRRSVSGPKKLTLNECLGICDQHGKDARDRDETFFMACQFDFAKPYECIMIVGGKPAPPEREEVPAADEDKRCRYPDEAGSGFEFVSLGGGDHSDWSGTSGYYDWSGTVGSGEGGHVTYEFEPYHDVVGSGEGGHVTYQFEPSSGSGGGSPDVFEQPSGSEGGDSLIRGPPERENGALRRLENESENESMENRSFLAANAQTFPRGIDDQYE